MIGTLDAGWRLRLGLACAGALLWFFVLLELDEGVDAALSAERAARSQVERTRLLAREDQWPAYRDAVSGRLGEFRERAWHAESEGLMQARLQDWLLERIGEAGVKQRELSVSLPIAPEHPDDMMLPGEFRVVRARVVFDFQPASFLALMNALSDAPRWLWVERLLVRNWGALSVELELGALFVIGAGGSA